MLKNLWQQKIDTIEAALLEELSCTKSLDEKLFEALKYSLLSGGKRLRPILLMSTADALGDVGEKYLKVACAIEMIHTYSLIHDDLPVMDNDDYRRGKLSNHKIFGEAIAILAGDALLTLAFETVLRQKNVPTIILLSILKEISIAAGTTGLVGGQAMDLHLEKRHTNLEILRTMYSGKTAALFRVAVRCGAILARATEEKLNALTRYSEFFSLAFQITDDILDAEKDNKNLKTTYVSLTSIETAHRHAEETAKSAIEMLRILGDRANFLRELVEYILRRKK